MASSQQIPVSSTEYLKVRITCDVTLSAQTVYFAVVPARTRPEDADWIQANWTGSAGTSRTAILLIGPDSDHFFPVGSYDVWDRVTDNPEKPTDLAGRLTIV